MRFQVAQPATFFFPTRQGCLAPAGRIEALATVETQLRSIFIPPIRDLKFMWSSKDFTWLEFFLLEWFFLWLKLHYAGPSCLSRFSSTLCKWKELKLYKVQIRFAKVHSAHLIGVHAFRFDSYRIISLPGAWRLILSRLWHIKLWLMDWNTFRFNLEC